MTPCTYSVEVASSRWSPFWTEMVTDSWEQAEGLAIETARDDDFCWVRLAEWENGERVRTTDYGRTD